MLREILKPANDPISPGDVLGRIEVDTAPDEPDAPAREAGVALAGALGSTIAGEQRLSPAVRELVKKHQIDLSKISGSGRDGRITHLDVENYLKRLQTAAASSKRSSIMRRSRESSRIRC